MRFLYDLLFTVGFILAAPYYFFRLWRRGGWREGFAERFGSYSARVKQALTNRRVVWIHAVSVGEANLAILLIHALQPRIPHYKIVVSTTTTTGMAELRRRLPVTVEKVYFPIDRRPWVRRAFAVLRPRLAILIEAELWPNFLWQARRRRVPVLLLNARLSPRSARRYRRASFLFRDLFHSLASVTAQSPEDARLLEVLGCDPEAVHVVGSLKFEVPPPDSARAVDVARLLEHAGMPAGAQILLAASTHDGEETLMAEIYSRLRQRHPSLYLVVVPRHFERGRSVGRDLERCGVPFVYRSEIHFSTPPRPGSSQCLLVNSTGELRRFYPFATVVFIGKSLIGRGGQNPLEPAAEGRAVVFGPHMQNFPEITRRLLDADAAVQVADAVALERTLDQLLSDAARRQVLGANARQLVATHRGALARTVDLVTRHLDGAESGPVPNPTSSA